MGGFPGGRTTLDLCIFKYSFSIIAVFEPLRCTIALKTGRLRRHGFPKATLYIMLRLWTEAKSEGSSVFDMPSAKR